MPLPIHDLNSGIKLYKTGIARRYLKLCPNGMAYSDVIALTFISERHLVIEQTVQIREREGGTSTVGTKTAFETLLEIVNIVVLFNPMKVFLPLAVFFLLAGLCWGLPIVLAGKGISVGSMLGIFLGVLLFFLGLVAEQISSLRKQLVE